MAHRREDGLALDIRYDSVAVDLNQMENRAAKKVGE
jgi:hypothetical protein